jgi:aminopeptidase YwaD
MRFTVAAMIFFCAVGVLPAQERPDSTEITAQDLQTIVRYLASDELEGRRSGSEGNQQAAQYIASLLESYGIAPAGPDGGFLQEFEFVSKIDVAPDNTLLIRDRASGSEYTADLGRDFLPLNLTSDATVRGDLVFAGYGISAPDEGYDDYEGLAVEGKVVVVLRFAPDSDGPRSKFMRHTALRNKARVAREKGAAGMIVITGPAHDEEDILIPLRYDRIPGSSGIPAITMKRALLASAFSRAGYDLKALQDSMQASLHPIVFPLPGFELELTTGLTKVTDRTANVLGVLKGNDPVLKDEVVIVGAHFDHLGWGGEGSGSMQPDTVAIHNGADDNASGTAGLLEIAQKLAAERDRLKRTVLFAFFSGEELGTLGSLYYVNNPVYPLERTVAMLNMDMIGRMEGKSLTIGGSGTSPLWEPLLARLNADSSFELTLNPDGFGPSDHASFYGRQIPVLFFFTGTHQDYHRPSDDWNTLNYPGSARIVQMVYGVLAAVDSVAERPQYARVEGSQRGMQSGDRRGFRVTLGIVPDVAGEATNGMKITGIRPGGNAERAGMKAGDVIVKMAGHDILNIYDYMGVLGDLKAGDMVEVELLREGRRITVTATMQRRD